jgi:hypothetical protein
MVYFPVLIWYPEYVRVYIFEYKRGLKLLNPVSLNRWQEGIYLC